MLSGPRRDWDLQEVKSKPLLFAYVPASGLDQRQRQWVICCLQWLVMSQWDCLDEGIQHSLRYLFLGFFLHPHDYFVRLFCLWHSTFAGYASDGRSSVCSGSMDAECYFRQKESKNLMSMPRTLAFCHLALLWVREAITLADLLRWIRRFSFTEQERLFTPIVILIAHQSGRGVTKFKFDTIQWCLNII